MRFRLPISGLLRSFRRNFLSTFLFLFAAWLIAREIRRYRDRQLLEEFLNRPPPSPQVPPAPPATVEQLEAECRAARFAREALDQMWEPLQMDKNPDVRAQYEENLAKMQGPKGEDCKMLMAQRNFSRPQDEWRWIFKNLPFTLMIDLDRKRGEKRDPNKPRPEPYLGIPEKADAITRMDLLATLSFFAQQLTSDRYGQRGVSANTFDQFHVVQGYKRWTYGYRRKDLNTGIVEDFTLFNNSRKITLENGNEEIEHFTNAKRFPSWLAVGNTTHQTALARRLYNRTSLHSYYAIKRWRSNLNTYLGMSGKIQRNADCGDGIIVRVTTDNNVTAYEKDIPPSKDSIEISFDVQFRVNVGTIVEIQVDPKKDDACDKTLLWAKMWDIDEDTLDD